MVHRVGKDGSNPGGQNLIYIFNSKKLISYYDYSMTGTEQVTAAPAPMEEIQQGWHDLKSRVGQLESEKVALEQENKSLRFMLERVVDHRQKSHNELVLILTTLVSKLPLNDLGAVIARLVEHNTNVSQYLAALIKGTADANVPQPAVLKNLDQIKRDLQAALQPIIEELLRSDLPFEKEMLESLTKQPELFFSPPVVRANRCFIKGYLPKDRVLKQFGKDALVFFNDMTTDPKLNPNPKVEEVSLSFKPDFESLSQQDSKLSSEQKTALLDLYRRVQKSKSQTEDVRLQKNAFLRMSFLLELIHFYDNQNTEAPDAIFAQRLPNLIEQLVLPAGNQDVLDEKLIAQAEHLITFVLSPDYRQMIVNNIGKTGVAGKTLKFVLRLRAEKLPPNELDQEIADFIKHLIPSQKPPPPETLVPVLRLVSPSMQRLIVKAMTRSERILRPDAQALGKSLSKTFDLSGLEEQLKAEDTVPAEIERQMAWAKIKDLIARRNDAARIAAAIRDRLNQKFDAEELKISWITLIEADPISLIRVFSQLPYRDDGSTDSIARPVMETYVSRLTHEKYSSSYTKVVNSLRNMYQAKPDSPTLVSFLALVKWVNPEAAERMSKDIGMTVPAH
jgi:hypothetical protein